MAYLLVSQDHVLDGSKFIGVDKLKPLSKVTIPTPIYRQYDSLRWLVKRRIVVRQSDEFRLGNMEIRIRDMDMHQLKFGHYNSHSVRILIDGEKKIELKVKAGWGVGIYPNTWQLTGVDYHINCLGEKSFYKSGLPFILGKSFFKVSHLPLMDLDVGVISDKMFFGIRDCEFDVTYNKRLLHDKYRAFVCGTWGILVDEELQFIALALFRSVSDEDLIVDKFVYTVNRRLVKEIMLRGGEPK